MSFAKLAAESIVADEDSDALDTKRSKEKRNKILLGVAALAGVAGLGGLAYHKWDSIKGALSPAAPKDDRRWYNSGLAVEKSIDAATSTPGAILGGLAAATSRGIVHGVRGKFSPVTLREAAANVRNQGLFPEKDNDAGGLFGRKTWQGPRDLDAMDAAARLRDPKSQAGLALGVAATNHPDVTVKDYIAGKTTIKPDPSAINDLKHLTRRTVRQNFTPGHMLARGGITGLGLTALPLITNWVKGLGSGK